jgi:hypothetical protein
VLVHVGAVVIVTIVTVFGLVFVRRDLLVL